ncbi:EpsG family protein [Xenorhabdus bovienii]|uniref:EpsG family protein n=1 Tax=Xenorhabdus bovienii TaxID=40576 RepID=UPI000571A9B1|nr:EpsG family protein [Xenorhabdus bovienii]
MIFYILASLMCCFTLIDVYIKHRNNNSYRLFFFILFLFIALFCGLRGINVDRDYVEYLDIYKKIPTLDNFFDVDFSLIHGDPIFFFIASIVKSIGLKSYFIFLFFALISLSIYRWCFQHYSIYPHLSLLIYFCHSFLNKEMTQIRAGLASSFILLTLCLIYRNKFKSAYVTMLLTTLGHSSGLLIFLSRFYNILMKRNVIITVLILTLIIHLNWKTLFYLLPQNLSLVQSVQNYMYWTQYNYSLSLLNPILLRQFFYLIIFFHLRKKYNWNKRLDVFIFMYLFSTCWLVAFNDMAILSARIANLFSVSELILIPYSVHTLIINQKKKSASLLLSLTIFLSLSLLYSNLEIKNIFNNYNLINMID